MCRTPSDRLESLEIRETTEMARVVLYRSPSLAFIVRAEMSYSEGHLG